MTLISIPRESIEAYPFTFALDDTPLTSGVSWALAATGQRPTGFAPAVTWNSNYPCFITDGSEDPGRYRLFAQTVSGPYTIERYVCDVIIN